MKVERAQHVIGEHVVRLRLQQVLQLLTRLAAMALLFFHQSVQQSGDRDRHRAERARIRRRTCLLRRPAARSVNSAAPAAVLRQAFRLSGNSLGLRFLEVLSWCFMSSFSNRRRLYSSVRVGSRSHSKQSLAGGFEPLTSEERQEAEVVPGNFGPQGGDSQGPQIQAQLSHQRLTDVLSAAAGIHRDGVNGSRGLQHSVFAVVERPDDEAHNAVVHFRHERDL